MPTIIPLICENCKKEFERTLSQYNKNKQRYKHIFCSNKCKSKFYNFRKKIKCAYCNKVVIRKRKELKKYKSGKSFCSSSCAAKYNNTHRTTGNRLSKSEKYLVKLIKQKCPELKIIIGDRKICKGLELDIVVPSLKLAIEWNGICHYKPIYGKEKFKDIKEKDIQKRLYLHEYDPEYKLITIIDTSKRFSEEYVEKMFAEKIKVKFNKIK